MRFSISQPNFVHLTPCGSYLLFLGFYCVVADIQKTKPTLLFSFQHRSFFFSASIRTFGRSFFSIDVGFYCSIQWRKKFGSDWELFLSTCFDKKSLIFLFQILQLVLFRLVLFFKYMRFSISQHMGNFCWQIFWCWMDLLNAIRCYFQPW